MVAVEENNLLGVTRQKIATRLGIAKPTVSYHAKSRLELLEAVVARAVIEEHWPLLAQACAFNIGTVPSELRVEALARCSSG